jgi:hypothetical protein
MIDGEIRITSHLGVFIDKANRQKQKIQKLLEKPKSERDKKLLKSLLKDGKSIRKLLKKMKNQNVVLCPHCGGNISQLIGDENGYSS